MARLLAAQWVIVRGSIAGTTYFSNQYHQIVMRARTAPVQPYTPPQMTIRALLNQASARWEQVLTEAQRAGWHDYAQTCIYSGPVGSYTVPGRQMYIATQVLARYNAGDTTPPAIVVLDDVPLEPGFAPSFMVQTSYSVGPPTAIKVKVWNNSAQTMKAIVWPSRPQSETRMRYKGPFEVVGSQVDLINTGTFKEFTFEVVPGFTYFFKISGVEAALTPGIPHRKCVSEIYRQFAG